MSAVREQLCKARAWAGRVSWPIVYDNVVRAAVLLTLGMFALLTAEQRVNDQRDRRVIECLAQYDADSAAATAARYQVAEQDRDVAAAEQRALDAVVAAVASGEPAVFRMALQTYIDIRAQADRTRVDNDAERAANPPPNPSLSCVR